MADEISQVVELECRGVYYLLKGTVAMIAKMAQAINAFQDWHHNQWLNKPGSCSWQKIQEVSDGMAPILEFPKEMFEPSIDITGNPEVKGEGMISQFEYYCRKNNLRYCIMPDFNPDDDYIPVAVPAQDMGVHNEQIKAVMNRRIESEKNTDTEYDEKISEIDKKIEKEKDPDKKKELEDEKQALVDGKKQNGDLLKESEEKASRQNVLEFADYLKQAKGTCFEKDPEKALMQAQGEGIVKEFMPEDCMYPIRDDSLVPESHELYYSQRTGDDQVLTVKRTFDKDENGCVFSTYEINDPVTGGLEKRISDKGMTMEAFAEKLPEILSSAGIMNDQPLAVTRSEAGYQDYCIGLDRNFTKAPSEGAEITPEAEIMITKAKKSSEERAAYMRSYYSTVTVPSEKLMPNDKQILSLELDDGIVEGVRLIGMDSDDARISIRSDEKYRFVTADGKEKTLTGDDIMKAIEGKVGAESESKALSAAKAVKR